MSKKSDKILDDKIFIDLDNGSYIVCSVNIKKQLMKYKYISPSEFENKKDDSGISMNHQTEIFYIDVDNKTTLLAFVGKLKPVVIAKVDVKSLMV